MLKSLIFLLILHHSFGANLQRLRLQNDAKIEPVSFQKVEKNPDTVVLSEKNVEIPDKNSETKISFVKDEEIHNPAEKFDFRKDVEKMSFATGDKMEDTKKESGKKEGTIAVDKKEEAAVKVEAASVPEGTVPVGASKDEAVPVEASKGGAVPVGTSKDGAVPVGASKDGAVSVGASKGGVVSTGANKGVVPPIGPAKEGASKSGAVPVGAVKGSATPVGAAKVGAAKVGTAKVGPIKDGASSVGAPKLGSGPVGAVPNEASKVGSVPAGTTKLGAVSTSAGVVNVEPVKLEASKMENVQIDSAKQQVVKENPVKEEVFQKEPIKQAAKVEVVKKEMSKPTTPVVKDESVKKDAVKVENVKNKNEEAKNSSNDKTSAKDDEGTGKNNDEDTGISKFSFLRRLEQTCQVGNDHGVCMSNIFECKNTGSGSVVLGGSSGWISNGGCASLTCCEVHQTCGGHDSKKVTYFTNPSSNQARDPCVYTINAMNTNICQVRIDFVYFSISPASQQPNSPYSPILCRDDSFDVITPNGFKAPTLCGYNSGQHMYIPLNASNNETMLQLRFRLAPRGGNSILMEPQWKIKVTQLECPYNNMYAMQNSEKDAQMVAPTGCLQYFTERTGTVCNFGYNPQLPQMANSYVTNMKYSICFKRTPDACGILFRSPANKFNLSNNSPDCTEGDYVFIPEGTTVTAGAKTSTNSRFCTNSINSATEIISTYSGPFSIQFSSDKVSDPSIENGFCLEYQAPPPTCY